MKIPIIIRSKDRFEQLYFTLNSLFSTNIDNNCDVTIVDDHSTNQVLIDFLTTNERIYLNTSYQNLCYKFKNDYRIQAISKYIKRTPVYVNGIKNKINVHIANKSQGDRGGILYAIKYGFENNPNADYIILLQNDIVFNKNWLTNLLDIYNAADKQTLGIITGWNYINNSKYKLIEETDLYRIYDYAFTGSPCFLIHRNVYNLLLNNKIFNKQFLPIQRVNKELLTSDSNYNIAGDTYLLKLVYNENLKFYITKKCYIQHIGNNISTCRNFQKIIIVNKDFIQPIEYRNIF